MLSNDRMRRIFTIFLALILLLGLVVVLKTREPRWKGVSLSEWVQEISTQMEHGADDPAETPGGKAIREIGERAVPHLLQMMDSSRMERIKFWINGRLNHELFELDDPRLEVDAAYAFHALGEAGRAGVPVLSNRLFSSTGDIVSALALSGSSDGISALIKGLNHTNESIRHNAALSLGQAETNRDESAEALLHRLQDSSDLVRCVAASSLGQLRQNPGQTIPVLIQALSDPQRLVRRNAASALGEFGMLATNALPALTKATEDSVDQVRYNAAVSIEAIQPGRDFVVPIISEGLRDPESYIREIVIGRLARSRTTNSAIIAELTKVASEDSDEEVRDSATRALTALGGQVIDQ